jgi:pimeloyl-ACP methyl ester carboxylesterase
MRRQRVLEDGGGRTAADELRWRLLAGAPVTEHRLQLAGVSTAVLEGGEGPPVVLLHGQGGWAGMWVPAIAGLVGARHVVAPDLPGLGASRADQGPPGAATTLAWLGELIERTCTAPPVLVGASLGGSIAARFAAGHSDRLAGLVLIGMGGLVGKVRLPPATMLALVRHGVRPSERTAMAMLRQVSVDPERARRRMGSAGRRSGPTHWRWPATPACGGPTAACCASSACARSRRRSWPGSTCPRH